MTTIDTAIDRAATVAMTPRRLVDAYVQEAKAECLRYLRNPGFLLPTLLFPSVFYVMFGIFLGHANSADAPRYLLASYGTFGVMAPGLFGFGVSLALEVWSQGLCHLDIECSPRHNGYDCASQIVSIELVNLGRMIVSWENI